MQQTSPRRDKQRDLIRSLNVTLQKPERMIPYDLKSAQSIPTAAKASRRRTHKRAPTDAFASPTAATSPDSRNTTRGAPKTTERAPSDLRTKTPKDGTMWEEERRVIGPDRGRKGRPRRAIDSTPKLPD